MKNAHSHSRGWTRRQKDILGFAATIALSAFILSGGFMASAWMEKLVPSFIDRTVYTDKTDVAGPVFSHNDNIRTFLTPWNLYDANHMRPVTEKEKALLTSWADMEGFIQFLLPAQVQDSRFTDSFVVSDDIAADNSPPTCFFLKNASATLSNNQTVFIDCSIQSSINSSSLYFYYRVQGEEESVPTEILDNAYQQLQEMLTAFSSSIEYDGDILYKSWITYPYMIEEAIDRFIYTDIRFITNELILSEKYTSAFEILRTDSELLLVFSLDQRIRFIYFVEPKNLEFRGFSIQM